jgi:hypothetical protein
VREQYAGRQIVGDGSASAPVRAGGHGRVRQRPETVRISDDPRRLSDVEGDVPSSSIAKCVLITSGAPCAARATTYPPQADAPSGRGGDVHGHRYRWHRLGNARSGQGSSVVAHDLGAVVGHLSSLHSRPVKTSASVPMSTRACGPRICAVEIRIYVDQLAPPSGQVRRVGAREAIPFSGWLDLIRVLERVIGELDEGPTQGRVDR